MRPSSSHAIRPRTHGLPGAGLTRQMIRQRSASSLRLHHRHDHWFADAGLCQGNEGFRGRIESPLGVLDLMDDDSIGELAQGHLDNAGVGQSARRIGPGTAIPRSPRGGGVLLELLDELRERVEIGHRNDLPDVRVRVAARAPRNEDRKSTRLNSSHLVISYAVFCLKKKKTQVHEQYAVTQTDTLI